MDETNEPKSIDKKSRLKIGLIILLIIIVAGAIWYAKSSDDSTYTQDDGTSGSEITKTYSESEALEFVSTFYDNYLPFRTQLVTDNGNNPNVEPAMVKAVRGSEDYFVPETYKLILDDYMTEYRSDGKVTKELVTCVSNTTSSHSDVLATKTAESAIVDVTINLSDGSTKVVPVTVDLTTLKISKIDCE